MNVLMQLQALPSGAEIKATLPFLGFITPPSSYPKKHWQIFSEPRTVTKTTETQDEIL
jgi:hypothetical protein